MKKTNDERAGYEHFHEQFMRTDGSRTAENMDGRDNFFKRKTAQNNPFTSRRTVPIFQYARLIPRAVAVIAGLALIIAAVTFLAIYRETICQLFRTVFVIFIISFALSITVLGRRFIGFGSVLACTVFLTVLLSVLYFSIMLGTPLAETIYTMSGTVMPVVIIIGGIWILLSSVRK